MIDFEKRQAERRAKIEAWEQAVAEIQAQLAALDEKEQAAMTAGDPDRLAGIIADQRSLTDRLDAYNRMIEHCPPPWTDDELLASWAEAAADHNERFSKVYGKYVKAMKEMYDYYLKLADMQHATGKTFSVMWDRLTLKTKQSGMPFPRIACVPVYDRRWRSLLSPVLVDCDPMKDSEISQRGSVPMDIRDIKK